MFEPFSRAYYLGRLYVEPYAGDRPVMHDEQHEAVNEQLYATGRGIERLDNPLVMKLGNRHLAVHGDTGIPGQTLAVPESMLPERLDEPPTLREVFLAKADRATQLVEMGIAAGI
ncbi:DUF5802 family protein [Halocatena pleomorpha]|uniref:Uncharacterized protein n=1 Tax=Halocatena pleomorpha TaxID=1785090 RepID=A0A3P3RKK5_9EURY|nr:DUF5802 family protein [Halocatena pleomorpha]RRJ33854.1 hypothetical protein EIK79_02735 [Halocatena pleomorpha]